MNITILGAGAWGTALSIKFAQQHAICLWTQHADKAHKLLSTRTNDEYLPGFPIPNDVRVTADLSQALSQADLILLAVPTAGVRATLEAILNQSKGNLPVVWVSKGLEPSTSSLMHEVIKELIPHNLQVGVLSGPSFAEEVAQGLPAAVTLASQEEAWAARTAMQLHSSRLRIYTSNDIVGVEIGGAVKNVMAIAAGISDGMGFGNNARAALITRGLAEMARLGRALGARSETMMGLAGAGDLILTCTGNLSRNRSVGLQLAQGKQLDDILNSLGHTAEGVHTSKEVLARARLLNVEMPITEAVCHILFGKMAAGEVIETLLSREPKAEIS